MSADITTTVLNAIDKEQLVQDVIDIVSINSPTGSEGAVGDFMEQRYHEMGLQVIRQEVEPGRPNVFGILRGTGGGPLLQFDGHLDVSFTGTESFMRGGTSIRGARVGEADGEQWIFGAGAFNMKAAHATYMAAVTAIIKSGVKLRGDIMLSATCGEIEASPVDEYQGAYYRGNGTGAAHAASHGIIPDFAILGEPTCFKLMLGHFGSLWSKLTLTGGTVIHTAYTRGAANKIEQLPIVIERLKVFKDEFEKKTPYKGYSGLVSISAIQGGRPWKGSRSPDSVTIYVDTRFPPSWSPLKVKAEIDAIVWELNSKYPELMLEHQPYNSNVGTEIAEDDYVSKSLKQSHQSVFKKPVETSYELWYSNAPSLNAMGTKAVNYGSAGARKIKGLTLSDRDREYVHIGDLVDCAKVYALTALDICSKTRREIRPDLFG